MPRRRIYRLPRFLGCGFGVKLGSIRVTRRAGGPAHARVAIVFRLAETIDGTTCLLAEISQPDRRAEPNVSLLVLQALGQDGHDLFGLVLTLWQEADCDDAVALLARIEVSNQLIGRFASTAADECKHTDQRHDERPFARGPSFREGPHCEPPVISPPAIVHMY